MTIMYALGWTQHSVGSQMIRTARHGAAAAGQHRHGRRRHERPARPLQHPGPHRPGPAVQPAAGLPDAARRARRQDYKTYIEKRAFKPLRPNQMCYWQNYDKFLVSLMKAWFGDAATKENNWCFDWLPKLDKGYDVLQVFEDMNKGKVNGYFCQGFNPLAAVPVQGQGLRRRSGQAQVPGHHRSAGHRDLRVLEEPRRVQRRRPGQDPDRGVPPAVHLLRRGGRLAGQLRPLAAMALEGRRTAGRGEGRRRDHRRHLPQAAGAVQEGGRRLPRPDPEPDLEPIAVPHAPSAEELAKEYSGKALADLTDPKDKTKVLVKKAGEQLDGFAQLRDDGSTSCGCWIFSGAWTEKGNLMARRDNSDPFGIGQTLNWAFVLAGQPAHPVQPRLLRPRRQALGPEAQADRAGTAAASGPAPTCRTSSPTPHPADGMGPFIMNPEGVARFFALDKMAEGPFPEHYEPFEIAASTTIRCIRTIRRRVSNPAARVFKGDWETFGKPEDFPYVATTYRLTEHFHFWTKHCAAQRHPAAGAVRRDRRGAGEGEGHQGRRPRAGALQPRLDHRRGGGHQAPADAHGERQEGASRGHPDPLGLQGPGQERLPRQHPDARSSATPTPRRRNSSRSSSTSRRS